MPERKPWPMKWIVLSIALFIVLYTYVNLRYRKPGPGYLPYEDARQKVQLARAGYQRVSVKVDRPADAPPMGGGAPLRPASPGLPGELRQAMFYPPTLPLDYPAVAAPASAASDKPYAIRFRCELADNRSQFSDAKLYLRGNEILVVPECERLGGELMARSRSSVIVLTVPPGLFSPGTYRMVLVGGRESESWILQVH